MPMRSQGYCGDGPRAQPCAVGSPCSGVCDLSPLPSSFFLSRPCRPPRPAAESCHPGTGLPSSPPPFTWMTDSIFSSRVCHSACGFEPHCLASRIMELQETVNAGLWSLSRRRSSRGPAGGGGRGDSKGLSAGRQAAHAISKRGLGREAPHGLHRLE